VSARTIQRLRGGNLDIPPRAHPRLVRPNTSEFGAGISADHGRRVTILSGMGSNRNRVAMAALPVLLAAVAALAAWQLLRAEHTRSETRIGGQATAVTGALQAQLGAYADVLYGVRGLFEASTNVSLR